MSIEKTRRLGRGLEALIPSAAAGRESTPGSSELRQIKVSEIQPNPFQPRHEFDPGELAELEASIRSSGLLQPIAVRRSGATFELISGERRLRAVTHLGWTEIPAIVKDIDDRTLLTLAMIENLQRSDLNAVEEAKGYRALIDDFGLTQQQVADAIGKDRTTIAGLLRILNLPASVLTLVEKGQLSAGHARALLGLATERDIIALSNETVARQLSVREVEKRVRVVSNTEPASAAREPKPASSAPISTSEAATVRRIEDRLRRLLQTDVRIKLTGPSKGTVEMGFYSAEDLDRLLELMFASHRIEAD